MSIFQERLKELQAGRKNIDFARDCGLSKETLAMYRKGSLPNLERARKIAKANQVSLDWLTGVSDIKNPSKLLIKYSKLLHQSLWETLEPLIKQDLIVVSDAINREKLSQSINEAIMKLVMYERELPDKSEILDLGDDTCEVFMNAIKSMGLEIADVALRSGYSLEFVEKLSNDLSEWDTDIAIKIGRIINVSPLDLLFPGLFDAVEKEYFEMLSSASPDQRNKIIQIQRAALAEQNEIPS